MSLFSWLFSKPAPLPPSSSSADPVKSTPPRPAPSPAPIDPLTDLKQQRHERREHLYDVVRSVMLRSEVLASRYKFKVLSLDARGRQFLVMIDLLGDEVLAPTRWPAVEQLMSMTAAQRHDLQIKSVYWRLAPPATGTMPASTAVPRTPVNAAVPAVATAAIATPTSEPETSRRHAYDPIEQEEVMAFKKAISASTPSEALLPENGQMVTSGPRKPAPPPGYEDTQLLEPDDAGSPLSRTQFGGLD
ncbi:hypothetical protein [Rhodoferax sp.]|uniref:hypothetical protein n=1 Tax=Rhodoferax sp. TaxID=50421 RepID=UPI0028419069|nr:hypothetical protein [Rhodoferax sp.]MDR3371980.1 hypothetical protein [Rhodoferax sp.]